MDSKASILPHQVASQKPINVVCAIVGFQKQCKTWRSKCKKGLELDMWTLWLQFCHKKMMITLKGPFRSSPKKELGQFAILAFVAAHGTALFFGHIFSFSLWSHHVLTVNDPFLPMAMSIILHIYSYIGDFAFLFQLQVGARFSSEECIWTPDIGFYC